ncbi:MAG: DUF2939 domain-containing protein [Mariprofundaceae bacterium]|nr:DUF2939 domain-containing protein [Mariprofundaceae bacterium]
MKKVILVAGLIVVSIVGYGAAGPYLTISEIKTGLVEEDSEKVSKNVDFPTLRKNLKEQFSASMSKNSTPGKKDGSLEGLGNMMMTQLIDRLLDQLMTDRGLAAMMEGKKKDLSKPDTQQIKKDDLFKHAKFTYDSISKFSIWVTNEEGQEARFILTRDGLSWRLVNIEIPITSS